MLCPKKSINLGQKKLLLLDYKRKNTSKNSKRKKGQIVMPSDYDIEFGVENTKKALLD